MIQHLSSLYIFSNVVYAHIKVSLFQVLQKMDESFTLRGLDESFVEKTPGDKYVCDICDYQTVHKSNLTRHQKTHWDAPGTPELQHFLCNVCGKGYKSRYGLSLHTKSIHENTFKYECAVCHKQSNTLWNHKGHVAQHDSALKEKCSTCQATFQYRKSLLRHKCKKSAEPSTATVRRKIKCDECDVEFSCQDSRKDHVRAVHGQRRLSCPKCRKMYKWRSSLYYHSLKCKGPSS